MDAIEHDLVIIDEFDAFAIEVIEPESSRYPAKLHAKKVAKELGVDHGLIYLPGKVEENYEDSDMGPAFRQRRYFYYLSGANFSGCAVTYDIGTDELTLWIPYTAPHNILWYGKTPTADECLARSDVDRVHYMEGLNGYLKDKLNEVDTVYVLHPGKQPVLSELNVKFNFPARVDSESLLPAMGEARVVKTDYEIAAIRKANKISSLAHRQVLRGLRGMTNEREIEAIFVDVCTAKGARSQAYAPIAGSGRNASTLHYDENNEPLAGRLHVVLDAGAEWECYASDITRTLPIGGKFTEEGFAIYNLVDRMQSSCIAGIRPGAPFVELSLLAHRIAVEGLLALGILHNGTVDEILKNGTSSAFFPHGLGHHVGLEVHDVPGYETLYMSGQQARPGGRQARGHFAPVDASMMETAFVNSRREMQLFPGGQSEHAYSRAWLARGRRKLEPGMIVTIEPGIYFCQPYIEAEFLAQDRHSRYINAEVLERYWDVGGVRIEDCILVTDDGYEVLSTAPKGDEMLKIINGGY